MKRQSYTDFWQTLLPEIKVILLTPPYSGSMPISIDALKAAGERADYRFTLEIENCEKIFYANGSAVAGDLAKVLKEDTEVWQFADDKYIVLSLGKDLFLTISAMGQ